VKRVDPVTKTAKWFEAFVPHPCQLKCPAGSAGCYVCPSRPKLSELSANARRSIIKAAREMFARSGVALPILSSDEFPSVRRGPNPASRLTPTDVVRVRFGSQLPKNSKGGTLLGKAYDHVDSCNRRQRNDRVAAFGLDAPKLSLTISHEGAHAFGLRHSMLNPSATAAQCSAGAVGKQSDYAEIMDYVLISISQERFTEEPMTRVEPPCPAPVPPQVDKRTNLDTHNPVYHLRAFALDEDPNELFNTAGLTPGEYDQACLTALQKLQLLIDITASEELSEVVVLERVSDPDASPTDVPVFDDPAWEVLELKSPAGHTTTIDARWSGETALEVKGASLGGQGFDLVFAYNYPADPQFGFTASAGTVNDGVILRYPDDGSSPITVGTFRASVQRILEADLSVALESSVVQGAVGETFSYAIEVTNQGADIANGVRVEFDRPPSFALSRVEGDANCTGDLTLECMVGPLEADRTATIYVVGKPTEVTDRLDASARVSATSSETTLTNNEAALNMRITTPIPGDVNTDGDVDREDLELVLDARNEPATGPDDRRDLDGDGTITVLDARKLTTRCTRPGCATQ